ncbi:hypothetical protein ACWFQ8_29735 [Streptomyces sp. NPDC055254]
MSTCRCGAEAVVQWRRRRPNSQDTEPVYACMDHALVPEAAGYVHAADCTGPDKNGACRCPAPGTPEFPFTEEDHPGGPPRKRKPPRW